MTNDPTTVIYEDAAGEWRWALKGGNGEIIADSGEGYTRKADAERALARTLELASELHTKRTGPTDA